MPEYTDLPANVSKKVATKIDNLYWTTDSLQTFRDELPDLLSSSDLQSALDAELADIDGGAPDTSYTDTIDGGTP